MNVIQVHLPEDIQRAIDRQIAQGRVASSGDFLVEAAQRFADDLALDEDMVAEARAGIADAEAGRFVTIATQADEAALHQRTMDRVRQQISADQR